MAGTASALVVAEVCAPKQPGRAVVAAAPPSPPPAPRLAPPPAPRQPPRSAAGPVPVAQIGAYGSRAAAEAAWAKLNETFPDVLAGKTLRIEPVAVGGGEVFRTSVQGFDTDAAAQAACAALMARSQACFVRKVQ